jgi:hypothetical protein
MHMANGVIGAIVFIIGLIVSTIIIFVVTRLFGEKEGIGRAFIAAIAGAIIYGIAHFLQIFGKLALRALYSMGWIKALVIAFIVWIFSAIVRVLLPTVT